MKEEIYNICSNTKSKNPIEILEEMMSLPSCHMHGPEHHALVGSALLTAYKNAGGAVDLAEALSEIYERGMQVPGGACGYWGACGAGISTGIFMSVITKSNPLADKVWRLPNQMTSRALNAIGSHGGPRCCKRDSYLAIREAVAFVEEKLEIKMEADNIKCSRSDMNNQCIKNQCPFHREKIKVAFVCIHNSCRSQIAEALGKKYLADICECYSAGTETKPQINQDAVRLMKKLYGIDMEETQYSKLFEEIPETDIVVAMGCNVVCPFVPGKMNLNWGLEDPSGGSDEKFMEIISMIEKNMLELRKTILNGEMI